MREWVVITLVTGPFSGIDYSRLDEVPMLAGGSGTITVSREPMVERLVDRHPRCLLTADEIPRLRERLSDPAVQRYYTPAGALDRDPPPFVEGQRNGGPYRRLPGYALSHLLEPEPGKLEGLLRWLQMATTYPHVGADLDAEYFMEGVALSYDWLYHEIPEALRAELRELLCRQARHIFDLSLKGRTGGGHSYQQNHYWFAHLALSLAASAVYGEVPEAREWLAWSWDRAERVFITFSPDGGFHEGPSYWDFSMPALYMLVDLYEQLTGHRVPSADQGLRGQAVFRLHHMVPGLERPAPLEDTTMDTRRPPIQLLLWEARRYQDPVAMGVAQALSGGPSSHAFNLLWLDGSVAAKDPALVVPVCEHYPDIETVFARTSWDPDATYVAAVSRPLGGRFWADMCDRFGIGGTGHNHPEQGHFVLFGRGEVLAHDPGYTYEKLTRNHNTVLVDGRGQFGDGEMWPKPTPGRSRITGAVSDGDITIIAADPSSAYPGDLGLTRFDRTIVLAGPGLVVVHDRLEATEPRTFSWLLHHIGDVEGEDAGASRRIVRGNAQLSVVPLSPRDVRLECSTYLPLYKHPRRDHTPREDARIGLVELRSAPTTEATFLVPLVIADAGSVVPEVGDLSNATADALRVGNTVVAFRRGAAEASLPLDGGAPLTVAVRAVVCRVDADGRQVVELP